MTLPECMALREIFAMTIFSVKVMLHCIAKTQTSTTSTSLSALKGYCSAGKRIDGNYDVGENFSILLQ